MTTTIVVEGWQFWTWFALNLVIVLIMVLK